MRCWLQRDACIHVSLVEKSLLSFKTCHHRIATKRDWARKLTRYGGYWVTAYWVTILNNHQTLIEFWRRIWSLILIIPKLSTPTEAGRISWPPQTALRLRGEFPRPPHVWVVFITGDWLSKFACWQLMRMVYVDEDYGFVLLQKILIKILRLEVVYLICKRILSVRIYWILNLCDLRHCMFLNLFLKHCCKLDEK